MCFKRERLGAAGENPSESGGSWRTDNGSEVDNGSEEDEDKEAGSEASDEVMHDVEPGPSNVSMCCSCSLEPVLRPGSPRTLLNSYGGMQVSFVKECCLWLSLPCTCCCKIRNVSQRCLTGMSVALQGRDGLPALLSDTTSRTSYQAGQPLDWVPHSDRDWDYFAGIIDEASGMPSDVGTDDSSMPGLVDMVSASSTGATAWAGCIASRSQ